MIVVADQPELMSPPPVQSASCSSPSEAQTPRRYFLKTSPLPGASASPYSSGLYVRHCGKLSGTATNTPHSLVLTPGSPVYLRGEAEAGTSRVVYTYEGRKWGMVMHRFERALAGWEAVEMLEGKGDEGFSFEAEEGGKDEVLIWKSNGLEQGVDWKGWMVCEWEHGHPQLFWVTSLLKGELPSFCQRVQLVREWQ